MRVGFFGGSFDPPHRGHLVVARAAAEAYGLERVLLAPTALQPLKRGGAEATFAQRMEMVELLCAGAEGMEASDVDGPQPDGAPNYTIDTLERLRRRLPPGAELFVVMGADSFLTVRQWRRPEDLLAAAEWIVVSRPGFDVRSLEGLGLSEAQRERVHLLGGVEEPVSATEVRARLHAHESCEGLVPAAVLGYIRAEHLYGV